MALQGDKLLWPLVIVLVVLWTLGMRSANAMGGLIHVLLVIAAVVILVGLIRGRRLL